jgi:hypothetical protein
MDLSATQTPQKLPYDVCWINIPSLRKSQTSRLTNDAIWMDDFSTSRSQNSSFTPIISSAVNHQKLGSKINVKQKIKSNILAYPDLQPRSTLSLLPLWDWPLGVQHPRVILMTDMTLSPLGEIWEGTLGSAAGRRRAQPLRPRSSPGHGQRTRSPTDRSERWGRGPARRRKRSGSAAQARRSLREPGTHLVTTLVA